MAQIAGVAELLSMTMRAAEAAVAVLASLNLAVAQEDGSFVLSEEAQVYLISDSPFFRRSLLDQDDLPRFQQTKAALMSEDSAVVTPFAVNLDSMAPAEIEGFVEQMHTFTLPLAPAVGALPAFAPIRRLRVFIFWRSFGSPPRYPVPFLVFYPHRSSRRRPPSMAT